MFKLNYKQWNSLNLFVRHISPLRVYLVVPFQFKYVICCLLLFVIFISFCCHFFFSFCAALLTSALSNGTPTPAAASPSSSSREANSRRLQTPEDHHEGHQQHNNLHADDSKISRIQPLRSYASTAFADLPSHLFDTNINGKHNKQQRYHRNHINYHNSGKLMQQESPNSSKQPRHHHAVLPADGKKLTNQEVLRWVMDRMGMEGHRVNHTKIKRTAKCAK